VERAYTGEQPDYSKNSHSFVCKFRKWKPSSNPV
jgi:hypothetical protein